MAAKRKTKVKKKRKFKVQPKVKSAGVKIPKKYTKKGNSGQTKRMAKEIKKYKGSKGTSAYFQWSGDTNPKTGKPYKTKESAATKAFRKKYGKKKK